MGNNESIMCPVCEEFIIEEEFNICQICGWVHNLVQNDEPNFDEGPNLLSLNNTKEWFKLKRKLDANYKWKDNASIDRNPTKNDLEKLKQIVIDMENKNSGNIY